MKYKILILALLFSIKIWGCKCSGEPNLKTSFENADFVFIGNVYEIHKVPSGFKTAKNILSNVNIEKIYKSNYYEGFYQNDATLLGSPLRSCDILFTQKGKYLIFAYYNEDTGFLYSDNCFYTKRLSEISTGELRILERLSNKFNKELKVLNSNKLTAEELENLDKTVESTVSNRETNTLKKEIFEIGLENKNLKTITAVLSFLVLCLLVFIISKRKNSR